MKVNQTEISMYVLILVLSLVLYSISAATYDTPNFKDPFNPNLPKINLPKYNGPVGGTPIFGGLGGLSGLIAIAFYIGIIVLLYFILRGFSRLQTQYRKSKRKSRSTPSTYRRNLEDARTRAYEIINKGLETGEYKNAFVQAYIALDIALEEFRDIKRPKYVTPKEYAYSVASPVFKPSVFRFVSNFYLLRYGLQEATRNQLISFKEELDYLFEDEVPSEIKKVWTEKFESEITSDYSFKIPRIVDPTRPGGK